MKPMDQFGSEGSESEENLFGELIGVSSAWRKVLQQIDLVASSNVNGPVRAEDDVIAADWEHWPPPEVVEAIVSRALVVP